MTRRCRIALAFAGMALATAANAQPAGQAWRPWDDPDWRSRGQEIGGPTAVAPPAAAPSPPLAAPPKPASVAPAPAAPIASPTPSPSPQAVASQVPGPPPVAQPAPAVTSPAVQPAPAPAAAAAKMAAVPTGSGRISPPPAGKSQVVFFRNSSLLGAALSFSVREQGRGLVKLGVGSYASAILEPGAHAFTVKSEAEDTLRLELEPDETYYVQETMGMGVFLYRPRLSASDAVGFDRYPKLRLSTQKATDTD